MGGLNGFSLIFSDVGVEPRLSDGILGVFCCNAKLVSDRRLWIVLFERSRGGLMWVMRVY